MRALVTGSTGFIGSHLCRALKERNFIVRAFHRSSSPLRALEGLNVEHAVGDLLIPETLSNAMKDVDVVFHVAATTDSRGKPERYLEIITGGTKNILYTAAEAKVKRLVYTSSIAALGFPELCAGGISTPVLLNENHSWNAEPGAWYYGYAKYMAELEVQKMVAHGLDAIIVNPSLVLGAGDLYRQTVSIIVSAARRNIPALISGGLNIVHINDVVEGHIAAFERGKRGERYILGGENLTIKQLIDQISEIAGVPSPTLTLSTPLVHLLAFFLKMLPNIFPLPVSGEQLRLAGKYFFYDTRKSQQDLGLPAPRPAKDAIIDSYNWFKETGAINH
jgi:dihydroflavonol-4-reductase